MTNPDLTLIATLLDRSGSMSTIADDTAGGYKAFLARQAAEPGTLEVTLAQFDHEYELVYGPTPVGEVPQFTLNPRGRTALLDAMGRFITDVGQELAQRQERDRPGTVIVVVMTDGKENASREWRVEQVRELVTRQQEQWNWTFLFLGANLDAVATAHSYGIARGQSITYEASRVGTYSVMDSLSRAATQTRSNIVPEFTEADRGAAMGEQ